MGIPSTMAYKLLNHMLMGTTSVSASTMIKVGLFNVASSDSTSVLGTELSGDGYDRVQSTGWTFLNRQAWNTTEITFPTATAGWSTAVAFGIFDSSGSSANLLYYGALDIARVASSGDSLRFGTSSIIIQFTASTDI